MTPRKLAGILRKIADIGQEVPGEIAPCRHLIERGFDKGILAVAEEFLSSDPAEFLLDKKQLRLVGGKSDNAIRFRMNVYDKVNRYPAASGMIRDLLKEKRLLCPSGKQIICDDVAFLHTRAGQPNTKEGKKRLRDHYRSHLGTSCYKTLDKIASRTLESMMKCEDIFGSCEWT